MDEELFVLAAIAALVVVAALARRYAASTVDDGHRAWRTAGRRLGLEVRGSEQLEFAQLTGSVGGRRILAWMELVGEESSERGLDRRAWIEIDLLAECFDDLVIRPPGGRVLETARDEPIRSLDVGELDEHFEVVGELADEARSVLATPEITERLRDRIEDDGLVAIEGGRLELSRRLPGEEGETDRIVEFVEASLEFADALDEAAIGGG